MNNAKLAGNGFLKNIIFRNHSGKDNSPYLARHGRRLFIVAVDRVKRLPVHLHVGVLRGSHQNALLQSVEAHGLRRPLPAEVQTPADRLGHIRETVGNDIFLRAYNKQVYKTNAISPKSNAV